MTDADKVPTTDLFSDISDLDAVRFVLADVHDDLKGVVARFRYLADLGEQPGRNGTMLSGGSVSYNAWVETRSSFVQGNFVATIFVPVFGRESARSLFARGIVCGSSSTKDHIQGNVAALQKREVDRYQTKR